MGMAMTAGLIFRTHWWDSLRTDGVWRTDPVNNLVSMMRFLRNGRVMVASIPGVGRLADHPDQWFQVGSSKVDDGRVVYSVSTGECGVHGLIHPLEYWAKFAALQPFAYLGGGLNWSQQCWMSGELNGGSLDCKAWEWNGRDRPIGSPPLVVPLTFRFIPVAGLS